MFEDNQGEEIVEDIDEYIAGSPFCHPAPCVKVSRLRPKRVDASLHASPFGACILAPSFCGGLRSIDDDMPFSLDDHCSGDALSYATPNHLFSASECDPMGSPRSGQFLTPRNVTTTVTPSTMSPVLNSYHPPQKFLSVRQTTSLPTLGTQRARVSQQHSTSSCPNNELSRSNNILAAAPNISVNSHISKPLIPGSPDAQEYGVLSPDTADLVAPTQRCVRHDRAHGTNHRNLPYPTYASPAADKTLSSGSATRGGLVSEIRRFTSPVMFTGLEKAESQPETQAGTPASAQSLPAVPPAPTVATLSGASVESSSPKPPASHNVLSQQLVRDRVASTERQYSGEKEKKPPPPSSSLQQTKLSTTTPPSTRTCGLPHKDQSLLPEETLTHTQAPLTQATHQNDAKRSVNIRGGATTTMATSAAPTATHPSTDVGLAPDPLPVHYGPQTSVKIGTRAATAQATTTATKRTAATHTRNPPPSRKAESPPVTADARNAANSRNHIGGEVTATKTGVKERVLLHPGCSAALHHTGPQRSSLTSSNPLPGVVPKQPPPPSPPLQREQRARQAALQQGKPSVVLRNSNNSALERAGSTTAGSVDASQERKEEVLLNSTALAKKHSQRRMSQSNPSLFSKNSTNSAAGNKRQDSGEDQMRSSITSLSHGKYANSWMKEGTPKEGEAASVSPLASVSRQRMSRPPVRTGNQSTIIHTAQLPTDQVHSEGISDTTVFRCSPRPQPPPSSNATCLSKSAAPRMHHHQQQQQGVATKAVTTEAAKASLDPTELIPAKPPPAEKGSRQHCRGGTVRRRGVSRIPDVAEF